MLLENPPFERGQTYFGTSTPDATSGSHLEGMEFEFEDLDLSTQGAKVLRSPQKVRVRVVRNKSGISLLPKRLVTFQASGDYGTRVDGYTRTDGAKGWPVDEWLPSTGVADNDLFYVVVKGPATVLTPLSNMGSDIAIGTVLAAITAATSQATTAGRLRPQDLTGATAVLGNEIQGRIGLAMSAAITTATNTGIMVNIGMW